MIKRALGAILILAIVAIVVVAAIQRRGFQSMVQRDKVLNATDESVEPDAIPVVVPASEVTDTVSIQQVEITDTLHCDTVR